MRMAGALIAPVRKDRMGFEWMSCDLVCSAWVGGVHKVAMVMLQQLLWIGLSA